MELMFISRPDQPCDIIFLVELLHEFVFCNIDQKEHWTPETNQMRPKGLGTIGHNTFDHKIISPGGKLISAPKQNWLT